MDGPAPYSRERAASSHSDREPGGALPRRLRRHKLEAHASATLAQHSQRPVSRVARRTSQGAVLRLWSGYRLTASLI